MSRRPLVPTLAAAVLWLATGLPVADAWEAPGPTPTPGLGEEFPVPPGEPGAPAPGFTIIRTADGREAAAGRVLIGFRPETSAAEREALHERVRARGLALGRALAALGADAQVVEIGGASLEDAIRAYRSDPRVAYAEPDYVVRALEMPDDPLAASDQWGLGRIQAPAAWDVTHGSSARFVAILDCGIYDEASATPAPDGGLGHPDLRGKVALRRDFTASPSGTDDRCNHGTHVAGIAAASTNNGLGIAGVGYDTRLLNGKVLDDSGSGLVSWVVNGIQWAADNGASVVNLSLGTPGPCPAALQAAIDYAWARNVVVVAAAGNRGDDTPMAPAACARALAVAATTSSDARASFSSYGTWVDVAAPGEEIVSSVNPTLNGGRLFASFSGTSMATPHVAGLAALVWTTRFGTSAQAVVDRITETADPIPGTGAFWQHGRVNALKAVAQPAIGVSPSSFALGPGQSCSATLQWDTGAGTGTGQVWLAVDGGAETLAGEGASGTQTVPGIQAPHTYAFRLYAGSGHATLLTATSVTAQSTAGGAPGFCDVPPTDWAYGAIEELARRGVTGGCFFDPSTGGRLYCPAGSVTRAQMAIFLLKAKHGGAYTPPPAKGNVFADVPASYWAAAWIEQLYKEGVSGGCATNPLRYCPEASVTRAQMAVFLLKAKEGASYLPPAAGGIFADVPTSYWAASWIEELYRRGITGGCATSPLRYCPESANSRREMAVFLVRTFP